MSWRARWGAMNAYDIHKIFVNEYVLNKKGTTKKLQRDTSKDKRDIDVIRENHQFLWDEEADPVDTWEKKVAKKYYDRLFKEYCIGDLSHYKEDKFGFRWRIEQEVIAGKGQFICGEKKCNEKENLRTWEVNFGYMEQGVKKNALVKLRLCPRCSKKLNYRFKRKEYKRLKAARKSTNKSDATPASVNLDEPSTSNAAQDGQAVTNENADTSKAWEDKPESPEKTEEQELDAFLQDLFM